MAQTEGKQNAARRKWANQAMGSLRQNEAALNKVAPALSPNVSMGATSHNLTALRKAKIKTNVGL